MTMEDEQMQTEDVQIDEDIQLPPMANQDVCNKTMRLGRSAGLTISDRSKMG